jgi:predicted RNA-binding protein (virulence factor B family)
MIELGKEQELIVVSRKDQGIYLGETLDAGPNDRVLLPKKQVPEDTREGDRLKVFIYRDSSDRLIATTAKPKLSVGEYGFLTVREITRIGVFLDWGLEKDLLLPYHEMTSQLEEGQDILAALYVDKSDRLAATMKVYPYLKKDSPYQKGDKVRGYVYQIAGNFGCFVAVDGVYSGLLPKSEPSDLKVGQTAEFRVTGVKDDGKLDLSQRKEAYVQMDEDAEKILNKIQKDFGGSLPFDDKADAVRIREVFGLSKNAFKRAVGRLYKERRILLKDGSIEVKA